MNKNNILTFAHQVIRIEISEATAVAERLSDDFYLAITDLFSCRGKAVVVGVGKNAPIAQKLVATLNSTGTPAQFLHAGEAMHGDLGLVNDDDVVLILSKSGNTPEIKAALPSLKKQAKSIVAIVGDLNSYLAQKADYVIDTAVSKEAGPLGIAPTSSTTAQLIICDALAMTLKKMKKFGTEDFGKYHPGGALGKQLLWTVGDIVNTDLKPQVTSEANIKEVIQSLTSGRLGITVLIENHKIKGVITDGDLRRMLENYTEFGHLTAKDIATLHPKTISKNTLAKEALQLINQHQIGQLVVVDEKNHYYGIIDFHALTNEGIRAE